MSSHPPTRKASISQFSELAAEIEQYAIKLEKNLQSSTPYFAFDTFASADLNSPAVLHPWPQQARKLGKRAAAAAAS